MANNNKTVLVKLTKSLNGRKEAHIATAKSLGLKTPGDTCVQPVNDATMGKLAAISFMIENWICIVGPVSSNQGFP